MGLSRRFAFFCENIDFLMIPWSLPPLNALVMAMIPLPLYGELLYWNFIERLFGVFILERPTESISELTLLMSLMLPPMTSSGLNYSVIVRTIAFESCWLLVFCLLNTICIAFLNYSFTSIESTALSLKWFKTYFLPFYFCILEMISREMF
jgi:hypothetical protein